MGLLISRLAKLFEDWGNSPARILMLGLDAAGKLIFIFVTSEQYLTLILSDYVIGGTAKEKINQMICFEYNLYLWLNFESTRSTALAMK